MATTMMFTKTLLLVDNRLFLLQLSRSLSLAGWSNSAAQEISSFKTVIRNWKHINGCGDSIAIRIWLNKIYAKQINKATQHLN